MMELSEIAHDGIKCHEGKDLDGLLSHEGLRHKVFLVKEFLAARLELYSIS
jgi:hypothetical protein